MQTVQFNVKLYEQTARVCNEIGRDLLGGRGVMYDSDNVKCVLNKGLAYILFGCSYP